MEGEDLTNMSLENTTMSTEVTIESALETLSEAIKGSLTRPIYLPIVREPSGHLSVEQVTVRHA